MASMSLNMVQLIGNLARDPELKTIPKNNAKVCNFTVATNRNWTSSSGMKQEETEYHQVIAWDKLAEICGLYLKKGGKVYVEGRMATRKYTGKDGVERNSTEVVANNVIILTRPLDAPQTTPKLVPEEVATS